MSSAGVVSAQSGAQPLTGTWQDGFVVQSAGGDYRLQIGALVQADGRFSVNDPPQIINTFTIRKARPIIAARLARYFDIRLMPDFGNGMAVLSDAYLDTRFSNALRVRAGKDKTPIGYEWLIGDASVLFMERSLASQLVPLRDVGFQALGDLFGGRLSYSAGLFNGVPDAQNSTTDVDTNNAKDFAGRVIVRARWGFGANFGGSVGKETGALPTFKTSIGQTWYSYASGAAANGGRTRFTPAAFLYRKSFGGFAEYMRSTQTVTLGTTTRSIANDGWDVTASWVLTGEPTSVAGVRPKKPFDPPTHHWGAVQVLARRSQLNVDPLAFESGFAAPGASRRAHQTAVGLNWYPTAFVKWYAVFEHTEFHAPTTSRPSENGISFRAQVAF